MTQRSTATDLLGGDFHVAEMPGHRLHARLAKRALRPGGLGLTETLLESLATGGATGWSRLRQASALRRGRYSSGNHVFAGRRVFEQHCESLGAIFIGVEKELDQT